MREKHLVVSRCNDCSKTTRSSTHQSLDSFLVSTAFLLQISNFFFQYVTIRALLKFYFGASRGCGHQLLGNVFLSTGATSSSVSTSGVLHAISSQVLERVEEPTATSDNTCRTSCM